MTKILADQDVTTVTTDMKDDPQLTILSVGERFTILPKLILFERGKISKVKPKKVLKKLINKLR